MAEIRKYRSALHFTLAVFPAFVLFFVFIFYPVINSLKFSFTDYDGLTKSYDWIGFSNYRELFFEDPATMQAITHNLIWGFFFVIVMNVFALFFAILLDQKIKARNLYRSIFFLPVIISSVAIGFVWSFIYDPQSGSLNGMLREMGLASWAMDWLGSYELSLYSIIFVDLWKNIGFSIVIFLAGLQVVPRELLEAALIDRANTWQRFWHVTFPLLIPTTGLVLVLSANGALRTFDTVYLMTSGGPGTATEVYMTRLFSEAFTHNRFGYASAMAWVVFIVLLAVAWLQVRMSRDKG